MIKLGGRNRGRDRSLGFELIIKRFILLFYQKGVCIVHTGIQIPVR
jgi:hypothetical protein